MFSTLKYNKSIYFLLPAVMFILSGCSAYEPEADDLPLTVWNMPISLSSSSAVVYSDSLYLFFGRDGGSAYSPQKRGYVIPLDNPTQFKNFTFPLEPRVKAATALVGDKLYCGLGFAGGVYRDSTLKTDWWCYDFSTRTFERKTDFIGSDTDAPLVWVDGDEIYVAAGFSTGFSQRVYKYSISADAWTVVAENGFEQARALAVGAVADGRFFAGGGYCTYMLKDWNEYDPVTCRFVPRAKMPTRGSINASAVGVGSDVYVLGGRYFGGDMTSQYFYRGVLVYDALHDEWSALGNMEQAAENMIAFHYDGSLYWGFGQREDGTFINKLYRYKL